MEHAVESPGRSLLVLGAGYVGGSVVRAALARGVRVSALTRNPQTAAHLRATGCAVVVEADLAGSEWHAELTQRYDLVVNCVSAGGGGIAGYRHSYLEGMRSLAAWLSGRPNVGTIVYTSSTGVYPQGDGALVDETAPLDSAGENGRVLREAELELARGADAAGWRWFVLRLAGIYGPQRHGMLDQLRAGVATVTGDPENHMNLIHRDDVTSAIWSALTAPPEVMSELFNVADGHAALRSEVADWLARSLGVESPRFATMSPSTAGNPFGTRRRAPDRRIKADRIREVLGWQPKYPDFRSGYRAIIDDLKRPSA